MNRVPTKKERELVAGEKSGEHRTLLVVKQRSDKPKCTGAVQNAYRDASTVTGVPGNVHGVLPGVELFEPVRVG